MIYLASPFSDPDRKVRKARHAAARQAVVRLTDRGYSVFSPVTVSCEMLAYTNLTWNDERWYYWSVDFLRHSDEVWVLMLDGWRESRGVQAEIAEAGLLGKPVRYLDPGTLDIRSEP